MFREVFRKVKEARKIKNKSLSEETGISPTHISKFLNGDRDVTTEVMWRLLEAMEQISPGAQQDFYTALSGVRNKHTLQEILSNMEPVDLLETLQGDVFADLIHAFADTLKDRHSQDAPTREPTPIRKSTHDSTSTEVYKELIVS
jgi:transcriptional regulator with XRE-family HTH domain